MKEEFEENVNSEQIDNEIQSVEEEQEKQEKPKRKKKKRIFSKIINLLALLLLLFVIVESVIGFMGFNDIRNNKEPKYYRNIYTTYEDDSEITTYDFGLYKVINTETKKQYSTKLVPFFLD